MGTEGAEGVRLGSADVVGVDFGFGKGTRRLGGIVKGESACIVMDAASPQGVRRGLRLSDESPRLTSSKVAGA